MLTLSCEDVRRELSAYHDEELSIGGQIAIRDHLENCPACLVEADDLRTMRDVLRTDRRDVLEGSWTSAISRLQSDILERAAAEERVSLATWARELLEDRRRAFATTGSAIAALLFVIIGVCQLGVGATQHPNSLAALIEQEEKVWAARSERPVMLPRVNPETIMPTAVVNQAEGEESYSAFAAVVTSNGSLSDVEFLGEDQATTGSRPVQRQLKSDLLAAAATASFQPASKAGESIPLNVVWIVTHRTVRGSTHARISVVTSGFRLGKTGKTA